MNDTIKKTEFDYWNQPELEKQQELIAGPAKWEHAEGSVQSHWAMITKGVGLPVFANVLEIGCGIGRILKHLSKETYHALYGVDLSPNMIEQARVYLGDPQINLSVVEDEVLPMTSATMDFVYSFLVFQHIPTRARVRKYLSEIHRVLKPGGFVRIQTYRGQPHDEKSYGGVHGSFYPSVVEFADEFRNAGFTVMEKDVNLGHTDWLWVTAIK